MDESDQSGPAEELDETVDPTAVEPNQTLDPTDDNTSEPAQYNSSPAAFPIVGNHGDAIETAVQQEDDDSRITGEITQLKKSINSGYNLRKSTTDRQIFASLSIREASDLYGIEVTNAAVIEELKNCIKKEVFEFQHPRYKPAPKVPSKMFLTPKKLPSGKIDKMKARLVAGGHRQDRSIYTDNETS